MSPTNGDRKGAGGRRGDRGEAAVSANAMEVLRRRYLATRREESGAVAMESPSEMFGRVARAVAEPDASYADRGGAAGRVEATAERFYQRMSRLEFLPNSPTLMNAGRELGQLAACFVVPIADSTEGIFEAVRWAAEIQKTGGGTGFSFSGLRPAGDLVGSTGGRASGPVAFMQVFDVATDAIKQGGARRGANMGILRVDHPDVLDFISVKLDPGRMRNFNLSVAVTGEFMGAVARGEAYALVNPRTGAVARRLDARRVFDAIANAAWATGDPGVVFIDRINEDNPTPALGDISATNPCGEQPLLPFESCTLGSINLARFARERRSAGLDWERLRDAIRDGVHFLDNVVDANRYPLTEIASASRATRKIGLGVMGFADLLIEMGVPYDSDRAVEIGCEIAGFLERESLAMSAELAAGRGVFPAWEQSRWAARGLGLRNATTTSIAPTGTVSIIAECSSGIEPLFAVAYERRVLDGEVFTEVHPGFLARAEAGGYWSETLAAELRARGRARGLAAVPRATQELFATAHDMTVEAHLRMQAAFQRHVHAAVSKTINLPFDATPEDIADAFRLADRLGCKGVTAYRDRSRDQQVLAFGMATGAGDPGESEPCPSCGAEIASFGRCQVCRSCGFSSCG
jgi:ribonucleoside-diphosphate reductase alpha chain